MSPEQSAIFLSYASQDAAAADRICSALRQGDLNVWFDQDALRGGDAWDHSIRDQIKRCGLFIPIISANTQARHEAYFRLEWKLAIDRSHMMADDQPFLIPVVIDDTHESTARVPNRLRERQWTYLPDGQVPDEFVEYIKRLLDGELLQPGKPTAEQSAKGFSASSHNQPTSPGTPQRKAIAVLPFINMSDERENEFFSDGVMEEILSNLAKVRSLHVISRTSAMTYKGSSKSIGEIAHELRVSSVLEGSVRRAGNRVRVTTQLIDATNDQQIWSERYDRDLDDIFEVQSDVAMEIARALEAELAPDTRARISQRPTQNMQAYDLYLQGRQDSRSLMSTLVQRGIVRLNRAVELDSQFGAAHAALAEAHIFSAHWGALRGREDFEEARYHAEKALQLNNTNAAASVALATVRGFNDRDWDGAVRDLQMITRAHPNEPEGFFWLGLHLFLMARFEDSAEAQRQALELDPLSPNALSHFGFTTCASGDPIGGQAVLKRGVIEHPLFFDFPNQLAIAETHEGHYGEAMGWMKRVCEMTDGLPVFEARYASLLRLAGKTDVSERVLQRLRTREGARITLLDRAAMALAERDHTNALKLLNECADRSLPLLYWLRWSMPLEEYASHQQEYEALWKKLWPDSPASWTNDSWGRANAGIKTHG